MLNTSFKQNANKDKAVLYLRYSSESQTENSIEGQRRECGAYAKQKGIQVIGEYIDRAKTGMSDERPDFQRMIRDSFSKGFGNVIVWKSDRFARDMADAINYQRKLMDNGVKLLSVTEPNLEGPIATLMNSISLGMNQYYSEELSVKVKRGVRENVINGKQIGGKPPFGYDYDGEGHYVVNPIEGPIISDVFRMYGIEKKSIFEIVRTDNPWLAGAFSEVGEVRRRPEMRRRKKRGRHPAIGGQGPVGEVSGKEKEKSPQQIPEEKHR